MILFVKTMQTNMRLLSPWISVPVRGTKHNSGQTSGKKQFKKTSTEIFTEEVWTINLEKLRLRFGENSFQALYA